MGRTRAPGRAEVPPAPPSEQTLANASALAAMCARKGPPRKSRTISNGAFERATKEMNAFVKANDWKEARPVHLVALYAHLHEKVYGFVSSELGSRDRMAAAGAASHMLKTHFASDMDDMVDFVRWLWRREVSREQWRREQKTSGGKISWRYQFGGKAFDEYRADLMRARGNPSP